MPTPEDEFKKLTEDIFKEIMRNEPVLATFMGLHEYDGLMPRNSRLHHSMMKGKLQGWLDLLGMIPTSQFLDDLALDARLLGWWLRLEEYGLAVQRKWSRSPDASEIIGDGLFVLFAREFAPFAERFERMCERIEAAPRLFTETLEKLDDNGRGAVLLWVEMELEATEQLPVFFDLITEAAKKQEVPDSLLKRWQNDMGVVMEALKAYSKQLREDILPVASGDWALGKEAFDDLIHLRELGMETEEILKWGEQMLEQLKAERATIAAEIDPDSKTEDVLRKIKDDHPPDFPTALELYRESIKHAREFVVEHDLATIPPGEELQVMETPEYLRHTTPFAAYFMPGKFDSEQVGVYIVTPCEPESDMMRHHGYHEIKNVSVHEGYPGHHLQLSAANTNPSLVRTLAHATETVEGWAHYCEAMMTEQGYDDTPEFRLVQNADLIWRACRIIVDIKLHTCRMGFDEAVEFMVENIGMERDGALAEVKRYTQYPTYQLSYLLGKKLINDLKIQVKEQMGERFTEKFFHDTIIYSGSMPVEFLHRVFEDKAG